MGADYIFGEDTPAARQQGRTRCPFCGADTAILSTNDVRADGTRIELYCENSYCAVREMTVLAMNVGEFNGRADVFALQTIDKGTSAERQEFGTDAPLNPKDLADMMTIHLARPGDRLRRRTRPTFVKIDVAPNWAAARRASRGETGPLP